MDLDDVVTLAYFYFIIPKCPTSQTTVVRTGRTNEVLFRFVRHGRITVGGVRRT